MQDLVTNFFAANPKLQTVGVITLPPGTIAKAIAAGGWRYDGDAVRFRPDLFATVDLQHFKMLQTRRLMKTFSVDLHNELSLLVKAGNPKHVNGLEDLRRKDLQIFLPHPLDEGIMSTYGKPLLTQRGLWASLSPGRDCKACRPAVNVYFTEVHHRETPAAVTGGTADVGLLWSTEARHAEKDGFPVTTIKLPPSDSLAEKAIYMIGALNNSMHAKAASDYIVFLGTEAAQNILRESGFTPATPAELLPKAIDAQK